MACRYIVIAVVFTWSVVGTSTVARAHCDALDGPVVKAAARALDSGDIDLVLIWVPAAGEQEVRTAYEAAGAVRTLSVQARTLADRYFFETVVRVHRAGEGAPFTGLKPAGMDPGPAISAADHAVHSRNMTALAALIGVAVDEGLRERFRALLAAADYPPSDVARGREYVHAYTEFVEYVERLYHTATEK